MNLATKTWNTSPDGSLTLELSVEINGEKFTVASRSNPCYSSRQIPFDWIERDMRRQLMNSIEWKLFGVIK